MTEGGSVCGWELVVLVTGKVTVRVSRNAAVHVVGNVAVHITENVVGDVAGDVTVHVTGNTAKPTTRRYNDSDVNPIILL